MLAWRENALWKGLAEVDRIGSQAGSVPGSLSASRLVGNQTFPSGPANFRRYGLTASLNESCLKLGVVCIAEKRPYN
jgi:hypothetical protein